MVCYRSRHSFCYSGVTTGHAERRWARERAKRVVCAQIGSETDLIGCARQGCRVSSKCEIASTKRRYALDTHRTTRRKVLGSLALGAGALFTHTAIGSNWAAYAQDETYELTWAINARSAPKSTLFRPWSTSSSNSIPNYKVSVLNYDPAHLRPEAADRHFGRHAARSVRQRRRLHQAIFRRRT